MGTQTMASPGGGGGQQSPIRSLGRQGSLYSLTLNEVQTHLGEPLHSMNLDDLLKNVFPAEGNPYLSMDIESSSAQYPSVPGFRRQGSITMNHAISKKTVDEVWRDIRQKKSNEERSSICELRQRTLGEMTLEDFLAKAGIVAEATDRRSNSETGNAGSKGFARGPHRLQQYHQMSTMNLTGGCMPNRTLPQPMGAITVYQEGQAGTSSPLVGTVSDPQTMGRKRGHREDAGGKTVERRQKRMIKNRESAARSRARKQAYTNELENKVSRLEEENERLKKQKELDSLLHCAPPPEPKYQLRRSTSAPF